MANKYYINYGTGAGNEWADSLEEAMELAEKNCCYTQCSIYIQDEDGNKVKKSNWCGVKYDPNEDPDEPMAVFGDFGYYAAWIDC